MRPSAPIQTLILFSPLSYQLNVTTRSEMGYIQRQISKGNKSSFQNSRRKKSPLYFVFKEMNIINFILMFSQLQTRSRSFVKQSTQSRIKKSDSYAQLYKQKKKGFGLYQSQNYIFQGEIDNFDQKQGQGILLMKNGTIMFGEWSCNVLSGLSIVFSPFGGLAYVPIINGKIDGWVVSLYASHVIITKYFEGKMDSERIVFDGDMWAASRYNPAGQLLMIAHVQKGKKQSLPSFLYQQQLEEFYEKVIRNQLICKFTKIKNQSISQLSYLGYCDKDNRPHGLGILFSSEEFYMGYFRQGSLHIFGRMMFSDGRIYHGEIWEGQFKGEAISYDPSQNCTSLISTHHQTHEIIDRFSGYFLVDFNFKIGMKMIAKINSEESMANEIVEILSKFYQSSWIENQWKQNKYPSNKTEKSGFIQVQKKKMKRNNSSKLRKVRSERYHYNLQDFKNNSQELCFGSSSSIRGEDPIQTREISKNFESIPIDENKLYAQSEIFDKKAPKPTANKKILPNSHRENQMTFRHGGIGIDQELNEQYILQKKSEKCHQSDQINKSNSSVSRLSNKIEVVMKKSIQRKKIF